MADAGRYAKALPALRDSIESSGTRAILGSIVAASVALALVWMFVTPFFQEPDENSHFDYAYALYSVGRPYRVKRAICTRDTTPTVRYLERRSDFYGVRFLPGARVPARYGTPSFFRSVDAEAPRPQTGIPPSGSATPCVMFTYPAGFYTLVAVTIALASFATHGSLVAEVFCARAIGIVCLACALPLSFALMRISGIRARDALIATAAIGVLPLTSWVSAYVQPDNLTFVLVTLALVAAMRWKRRPFDLVASIFLGSIVSLLFFNKQPYGLVVYAACALLVASRIGVCERSFATLGALTCVCIVPLAAIVLSTFATPVGSLRIGMNMTPPALDASGNDAFHVAMLDIAYAARTVGEAFLSGASFHTFWNGFGWTSESYFKSDAIDRVVESILGVASLVVVAALLVRQTSVARRLARVALRRSAACALRLFGSDVVLNAYLLWTGLLIAVCAASRGTWPLQGRYWLPVIVPMVILLVRRVPRILSARARCRAATFGASALLGYACIAAPFALAAMHARYYGSSGSAPRSTVVAISGLGFFGQALRSTPVLSVRRGEALQLEGLAFRATDAARISRVVLLIDGGRRIATRYGFAVPTGIAPLPVGFAARIATRPLVTGRHRLSVLAYTDAIHFDRWDDELVIVVLPSGGRAQVVFIPLEDEAHSKPQSRKNRSMRPSVKLPPTR